MIRVLLDTNAYAAFKRGHAETVAILQRTDVVALTPVVLGELLGGFAAGNKAQQNRAELATFLSSRRVWTVSVDALTAERHAEVYVALRAAGTPIPTNDMWIAASALQHGLPLLTFDLHFRGVPGLTVVQSVADLARL